ncbi:MAG TPA: trypsin-like peptidase domain-containing protein [Bryobacteraceae bacterium]|nr:trypsin-like peptidase domain-containing protein [Bryobacteraceae bacterium]
MTRSSEETGVLCRGRRAGLQGATECAANELLLYAAFKHPIEVMCCRMFNPTRVAVCLLLSGLLAGQTVEKAPEAKAPDALHDLSMALETLSRRTGRAVVQVFSTGYALNSDENESTNTAYLTRQRSTGAGAIISEDGYIVTNAHVVQGGRRIQVQLAEVGARTPGHSILQPAGKRIDAKIVGIDRDSDLAVLKIDRTGLPILHFGNSEELRQGQLVLAFGNPLGLANSVSMGVVSSVARQIKPDDPMIYIQTDAPINPGNSGGPLLDADGRIVGINTFILTQSGGSEGIGFAIPSSIVRNVVYQIRKNGHVHRAEIGVYAQTITPALAAGLGLARDWGVILGDVEPDGPADKAGMKIADIVLSLDGKPMENARQLQVNLYRKPVGDKVTLEVLRGDQKQSYEVEVIERDDDPLRFADLVDPEKNVIARLGILGIEINQKIASMLPELREQYGVVVAARAAGSSYSTSLEPGDVIHAINGLPVSSIASVRQALDNLKTNEPAVLQLERNGRLMYLALELE